MLYSMPVKAAQAIEAEYDAMLGDPAHSYADIATQSMDAHAVEVLVEQVEFVGYKAQDLDELRGHFHHMDGDGSGTVDVDEFFAYIKEPRTPCSEYIFKIHGQKLGANDIAAEQLDFAMFVKAVSTLAMLDDNLLCRFYWHMFDTESRMVLTRKEVRRLLDMVHSQYPTVCSQGQLKRVYKKNRLLDDPHLPFTFEEFWALVRSVPTLMYPAQKLQYTMQKKFLGYEYWQKKKAGFVEARSNLRRQRDNPPDSSSKTKEKKEKPSAKGKGEDQLALFMGLAQEKKKRKQKQKRKKT